MNFTATLIPAEEVTPLQLASFKRHKRNGTSPGNPKWYRPRLIRPFVPQLSQRLYRVETGQEWHTAHGTSRTDPFLAVRGWQAIADYVRAYETALNLKPVDVAPAVPQRQRQRQRLRRAA